ncbi:MAG: pantetheine-phosphate adenylyltransferase [Fibrobacterota bacterium]
MPERRKLNVVYPGSFDPVTFGHLDLIIRARDIFQKVFVVVAHNSSKNYFFTSGERVKLIYESFKEMDIEDVEVEISEKLITDISREHGYAPLMRGLRAVSDFEYEFQMALTSRRIDKKIETVFMMPSASYTYLSSSLIKEISSMGGDISKFAPKCVIKALKKKHGN